MPFGLQENPGRHDNLDYDNQALTINPATLL
jgi:hypothetical protein